MGNTGFLGTGIGNSLNEGIRTGIALGTTFREQQRRDRMETEALEQRKQENARSERELNLREQLGNQSLERGTLELDRAKNIQPQLDAQALERGGLETESAKLGLDKQKMQTDREKMLHARDMTLFSQMTSAESWAKIYKNPASMKEELKKNPALARQLSTMSSMGGMDLTRAEVSETQDGGLIFRLPDGTTQQMSRDERFSEIVNAEASRDGILMLMYRSGTAARLGFPALENGQEPTVKIGDKTWIRGKDGRFYEPTGQDGNPIPQGEEEDEVLSWATKEAAQNPDVARTLQALTLQSELRDNPKKDDRQRKKAAQEVAREYQRLGTYYQQASGGQAAQSKQANPTFTPKQNQPAIPNTEEVIRKFYPEALNYYRKIGKKPTTEEIKKKAIELSKAK